MREDGSRGRGGERGDLTPRPPSPWRAEGGAPPAPRSPGHGSLPKRGPPAPVAYRKKTTFLGWRASCCCVLADPGGSGGFGPLAGALLAGTLLGGLVRVKPEERPKLEVSLLLGIVLGEHSRKEFAPGLVPGLDRLGRLVGLGRGGLGDAEASTVEVNPRADPVGFEGETKILDGLGVGGEDLAKGIEAAPLLEVREAKKTCTGGEEGTAQGRGGLLADALGCVEGEEVAVVKRTLDGLQGIVEGSDRSVRGVIEGDHGPFVGREDVEGGGALLDLGGASGGLGGKGEAAGLQIRKGRVEPSPDDLATGERGGGGVVLRGS
jgi:hypothetical protein